MKLSRGVIFCNGDFDNYLTYILPKVQFFVVADRQILDFLQRHS